MTNLPANTTPIELELGRWRTYAANERTILSNLRTSLGWAALLITVFFCNLVQSAKWAIFGAFAFGVVYFIVYGIISWLKENKGITAEQNSNMHANTRTRLSNNRNFLAFVRACQPIGALMLGDLGPVEGDVASIVARVILGAIITVLIGFAAWVWKHNDEFLKSKPSTHDLAISRTLYSNSRCLMAYTRSAFACWALGIVLLVDPDLVVEEAAVVVLIVGLLFLLYAAVSWIQYHGKALTWRRENMPRPK